MDISVIVPLYRGGRYVKGIKENIERNEKHLKENFGEDVRVELIFINDFPEEHIIVDNDSTLNCICFEHTQNYGIHKSRVDGFNKSRGELILFLDQDDAVSDDYLLNQIQVLCRKKADWVICNGIFRSNRKIYNNDDDIKNVLDAEHYFGNLTEIISPGQVLLKKDIVPKEWCDTILTRNYCDDAFLWILLKDRNYKLVYNHVSAFFHNENGKNTSFSWKNNVEALRELKEILNRNDYIKSEHLVLFNETVENEIFKQLIYGQLEDNYSLLTTRDIGNRIRDYLSDDKIIIYGFGIWGRRLYKLFGKYSIDVSWICDSKIQGKIEDIVVISPKELFSQLYDWDEYKVMIAAPTYEAGIRDEICRIVSKKIKSISIGEFFDLLLK